jgi:hypothetical protein
MPNRILKESICTSENVDQLSAFQETVFYRLIVNCDDYGRMDARPKLLSAKLFPLKYIRAAQIEDALRALTSAELVTLYTVDGKPFLQMKTWDRHQQVRAKKSKYPSPDGGIMASDSNCNQMIASDSKCPRNPIQSVSVSESNPNGCDAQARSPRTKTVAFDPPTVEDVRSYCREKGLQVDAERFVAYYTANGWKVGRNPMKDWRACCRTWVRNSYDKPRTAQTDYSQREYEETPVGEIPQWLADEIEQEEREMGEYLAAHGLPDTRENRERLVKTKGVWEMKGAGA